MDTLESAAGRIVASVSELLGKPLYLVDGQSAEAAGAFAVRMSVPRLAVVCADGTPFLDRERRLIEELFGVMKIARESDARYSELEERMLVLQRENVDLSAKNRILCDVSSRDSLTGLYNRGFVIEKIDRELSRALRHGSPVSLLMLDLDHFKQINDTWGHAAGDQVLQTVGRLLRDCCRVYDVPGRYGGEEFCIVLPETNPGATGVVAERIRQRLAAETLHCGESAISVTASIGIAGVEQTGAGNVLSPAVLIDRADRALYSAKHRGRNRVELWDEPLLSGADAEIGH